MGGERRRLTDFQISRLEETAETVDLIRSSQATLHERRAMRLKNQIRLARISARFPGAKSDPASSAI